MKIERPNGNVPETTNESQVVTPDVNVSQPTINQSGSDSSTEAPLSNQQSAARRHAVWQRGSLEMYGAAQQWKLSRQTQSDSQTTGQFRNQSVDTESSVQPSFASQRRNAISRSAVETDSDSRSNVATPEGNLPIATPDTEPQMRRSTTSQSSNVQTKSGNKSWNYQYERSINVRKSNANQSTDSSTSKTASSDDQGYTHSKKRSNIARGSGGLTAYGEGQTTSESGSAAKSWDKTFAGEGDADKGYAVKGEAAVLETRSRTYKYDSGLGVGAQAEASLVRGKVGVQANTGKKVGNAEIVGASGNAEVDGMVGARATAEAGVGVGRDGLPAVRVGAEAFAGARVDTRAGGEARVMGVGADARGTASAMAGAQASTEATATVTGIDASASAFAGASAGASGSASVAGVGGSGSAEAWAGVGARAEAGAGYTDGKLQFKFGLGAALGVGGAVGGGFSWDLNETKTDFDRATYNTKEYFTAIGPKVTSTASSVANTLTVGANSTAQAVNDGAKVVSTTAGNAVDEGTKVATVAAKTASKTAAAATKTVSSAAKSAGKTASNIAKSIFKF
jgi:hypothetical protein